MPQKDTELWVGRALTLDADTVSLTITALQMLAYALYFRRCHQLRVAVKHRVAQARTQHASAAQYAVYVSGLPPQTTEGDVLDHFDSRYCLAGPADEDGAAAAGGAARRARDRRRPTPRYRRALRVRRRALRGGFLALVALVVLAPLALARVVDPTAGAPHADDEGARHTAAAGVVAISVVAAGAVGYLLARVARFGKPQPREPLAREWRELRNRYVRAVRSRDAPFRCLRDMFGCDERPVPYANVDLHYGLRPVGSAVRGATALRSLSMERSASSETAAGAAAASPASAPPATMPTRRLRPGPAATDDAKVTRRGGKRRGGRRRGCGRRRRRRGGELVRPAKLRRERQR